MKKMVALVLFGFPMVSYAQNPTFKPGQAITFTAGVMLAPGQYTCHLVSGKEQRWAGLTLDSKNVAHVTIPASITVGAWVLDKITVNGHPAEDKKINYSFNVTK